MRSLGVIPARGGSKGVLRKNLREVGGKPLLVWSFLAAAESQRLDSVVVSTEDPEIADLAKAHDVMVVERPPELATDEAPVVPVVRHALKAVEALEAGKGNGDAEERSGSEQGPFDLLLLLQPTAPMRRGEDLDAVLRLLEEDDQIDGIVSVTAAEDPHPARMYHLHDHGRLEALWPAWENARRQDLPRIAQRNGALYAVRRSVFLEEETLMPARKRAYLMPREMLANIDDERDLAIADVLVRQWAGSRGTENEDAR